jgi:hypothetical protein
VKQKINSLKHEFVEVIPEKLKEGMLYVCIEHGMAAHNCCCGCGTEIYTPITPTDWKLTYDGETVTLDPSIGNSTFPCESHYWIRRNQVRWERKWTPEQTQAGRAYDTIAKQRYFGDKPEGSVRPQPVPAPSRWQRFKRWFKDD